MLDGIFNINGFTRIYTKPNIIREWYRVIDQPYDEPKIPYIAPKTNNGGSKTRRKRKNQSVFKKRRTHKK
jgi:hypothetical protein